MLAGPRSKGKEHCANKHIFCYRSENQWQKRREAKKDKKKTKQNKNVTPISERHYNEMTLTVHSVDLQITDCLNEEVLVQFDLKIFRFLTCASMSHFELR